MMDADDQGALGRVLRLLLIQILLGWVAKLMRGAVSLGTLEQFLALMHSFNFDCGGSNGGRRNG
jgi:hypothetical protein